MSKNTITIDGVEFDVSIEEVNKEIINFMKENEMIPSYEGLEHLFIKCIDEFVKSKHFFKNK